MTIRTPDDFTNVSTGLYKDNTAGDISAGDLRDLVDSSMLITTTSTVTTADVTGVAGNHYELDVSGLTADRNFTLPASAVVGSMISLQLTTAAAAGFELIIKGAATVSINGGTAATEWSRLFTNGEAVVFRARTATNWAVVIDKRIPCSAVLTLSTAANDTGTGSWIIPTSAATTAGVWTEDRDIGACMDHTIGKFTCRRAGTYQSLGRGFPTTNLGDGANWGVMIHRNNTTTVAIVKVSPGSAHREQLTYGGLYAMAQDDYVELKWFQSEASKGISVDSTFTVQELL